jgi:hypothetical protein
MAFDPTISMGTVIEIGSFAVGWIVTIVKIDTRLKSVERDIKEVTQLTRWRERMEERMLTMRRDVDDLRHGRGFVKDAAESE